MKTTRPLLACVAAILALTHQGAAQRCALPDTTADWYSRQRAWWMLDRAHDWSDDTLRTRLLNAATGLRANPGPGGFPIQWGAEVRTSSEDHPSASVLEARSLLRDMARSRKWPVRSLVGSEGVYAAWRIAMGDSALATTAMHRLMEAGPGEAPPADVAVLEDRMRIKNGRKQLYASQLSDGYAPLPTEDSAHVDLRRDAAGLPPLAKAICAIRSGR